MHKKICKFVLLVYIVILTYFVILKLYLPKEVLISARELILKNRSAGYYNVNIIPFKTLQSQFDFTYGINYINILGNTLPFILLGCLTVTVKNNKSKIIQLFIYNILLIVSFELLQLITCIGVFDIDDILLNGVSCYIGIILYCKGISKLIGY